MDGDTLKQPAYEIFNVKLRY